MPVSRSLGMRGAGPWTSAGRSGTHLPRCSESRMICLSRERRICRRLSRWLAVERFCQATRRGSCAPLSPFPRTCEDTRAAALMRDSSSAMADHGVCSCCAHDSWQHRPACLRPAAVASTSHRRGPGSSTRCEAPVSYDLRGGWEALGFDAAPTARGRDRDSWQPRSGFGKRKSQEAKA
jgi:hypothetical protein